MQKNLKVIAAGITATAAMSILIAISPLLGLPRLAVWEKIASVLKTNIAVGWLIHFGIGIAFAFIYAWLARNWRIFNGISGGLLFGFNIFLGVQLMTILFLGGSNLLLALGSLIGHLAFGGLLGLMLRKAT